MWVSTRPEPVRKAPKVYLVYLIKNSDHALLNDFVFQRRDPDRTFPPIGLRYVYSSRGLSPIGSPMHTTVQVSKPTFHARLILPPRDFVNPGRSLPLQRVEAVPKQIDSQMVKQGCEPFLFPRLCCFTHTAQSL